MSEAVIVALVTGGLALLGNVVTNIITSAQSSKLTAYQINELRGDLAELSTRVDKHNNLVERMAIAEQSIKSAHKRIDGIEQSRADRPE